MVVWVNKSSSKTAYMNGVTGTIDCSKRMGYTTEAKNGTGFTGTNYTKFNLLIAIFKYYIIS